MNIPPNFRTLKKLTAGALLAGGLGVAVIGLGPGIANANPTCGPTVQSANCHDRAGSSGPSGQSPASNGPGNIREVPRPATGPSAGAPAPVNPPPQVGVNMPRGVPAQVQNPQNAYTDNAGCGPNAYPVYNIFGQQSCVN